MSDKSDSDDDDEDDSEEDSELGLPLSARVATFLLPVFEFVVEELGVGGTGELSSSLQSSVNGVLFQTSSWNWG
jgi:hypothetical protein